MLDTVIRGGTVVDGTGAPARTADIGIAGGRVVAVGAVDDAAHRTVDADGLLVCPGFVDPHTHYDAQLFWDPYATPSSWHGVTTVIGGNCGFTLAPLEARDADYTRRLMARVEGMPLDALEAGVPWDWRGFDEYLDRLDGAIGVNAGFLVGHCALRRAVLGEEANARPAGGDELESIASLLRGALAAGALGLSTSRSPTHVDGDGEPVPSRAASVDEVLELCRIVGEYPGTTLEAIIEGCLARFSEDDMALFADMSAAARRPLNWNVLGVDAKDADRPWHQLEASARARASGGRVVALTMPVLVPMTMSFAGYCALWLIPGWGDIFKAPIPERTRLLLDPDVRGRMLASARASSLSYTRLAEFGNYVIGDTFAPANAGLTGRRVDDVARERGTDPFTAIAEIAAADELQTVLWPQPTSDTDADWALRRKLWEEPDILLGGSDAGAHVDRSCGAPYPTRFLADTLRGRRLVTVERAVQLLTDAPARLFGLRDRGRLVAGAWADVAVVDPTTVDAAPPRVATDMPGGSGRLVSSAVGVAHVFVNGVETMADGSATGTTAGALLRSGRGTYSVVTG
ncbi:MAG TPA: amidohydrolase family protein [Acidimicrobiales bacterium]|nr:amidohydrolase family protein [Acidimicrobiales bacterium]